jgi:hypothetical protein
MDLIIYFGLIAIIFAVPVFAYAFIFKSVGIITRNPKCSYLRILLINLIFLGVIFGVHCLAVALSKTLPPCPDNLICRIFEFVLTVGCGTILFKKSLSLNLIICIVLSAGIYFAQLYVAISVISNLFRM